MKRRIAVLLVAIGLAFVSPRPVDAQEDPGSPRSAAPVTFLQINDVYSTVPIDGLGGLARVATIKQNLAAAGRTPVLVLAGDFLSPSVASSVFKGEQMIAALNAAGLDLATLGNHEFDFGEDLLIERMKEARWQWVVSNVVDTRTGRPIGGALPYVVKAFGSLKVGFLGLCLDTAEIVSSRLMHVELRDPLEAAATYLPRIAAEGADVVVAITHLPFPQDRELAARFPQIDLIIGGHEHYPITVTEHRTLISKAGSDAKFVARIDVDRTDRGALERFYELVPVTSATPDDEATKKVVSDYESRLGNELEVVVGRTAAPLDADTLHLRAGETNLGNLVADAVRADVGADVAILNSGSIRGDRVYPAGPLTRRTVIAMHPFGNVICKVAVPGRVILEALNSGVSRLPITAGQFPQVSGLTMSVDVKAAAGDRVHAVRIKGEPLEPQRIYSVALTDYQLQGGDSYGMFKDQPVLIGPEAGPLLVTALEKYIAAHGEVNPRLEGRIRISR